MKSKCNDAKLAEKLAQVLPLLDERQQRLLLAAEARSLGYGGVSQVARACGVSRPTIHRGLKELDSIQVVTQIRRPGGGRKRVEEVTPTILTALEQFVSPDPRSDPLSPLRWSCKSTRQLAAALKQQGYRVSHQVVAQLLHAEGYSLQKNAKVRSKAAYSDRDEQFHYLNKQSKTFLQQGLPVICVDVKKKEVRLKNPDQEWQSNQQPNADNLHAPETKDDKLGTATLHGSLDIGGNTGWVCVEPDRETGRVAVFSLQHWWQSVGSLAFPTAKQLLISADDGINGYQLQLWRLELQRFANTTGLEVTVCHLPPGISKWNKIEHRLFCQIGTTWRDCPLVSHEVTVDLIGSKISTSLQMQVELNIGDYPTQVRDTPPLNDGASLTQVKFTKLESATQLNSGVSLTDAEIATVQIAPHQFHGQWNYTIAPNLEVNSCNTY